MPLHLLSKKSWNVYNPAAIAKVRADEAEAAAREEAQERQIEEYEAQKRLALLRGEEPPSSPPALLHPSSNDSRGRTEGDGKRSSDPAYAQRRKRRKLAGEDDTDRDIRVAAQEEQERRTRRDDSGSKTERWRDVDEAAPIVDAAGHIQLFAPRSASQVGAKRDANAKAERKLKETGADEGGTLRFSNASGFQKAPNHTPWYATKIADRNSSTGYSGTEEIGRLNRERDYDEVQNQTGTDVFGNEDPGRHRRDAARLSATDPLAAMTKAQTKLKQVEKSREASRREREDELAELARMQRREEARELERRKRREPRDRDGYHELENSSLHHESNTSRPDSRRTHGLRKDHRRKGRDERHHRHSRYRHQTHEKG